MTHANTIREVSEVRRRAFEPQSPHPLASANRGRAQSVFASAQLVGLAFLALLLLALGWSHRDSSFEARQLFLLLVGAVLGMLVVVALTRPSSMPGAAARGSAPTILGQYTLGEKIGEGGMGVVYKARHALLERPTAIKLLHPGRAKAEDIRRFEREVQLTSKLTHPNTISVYDFGQTEEGAFYYAMEYLDGLDLQTLVEREGPQDPARVAHWLAQLCAALSEAHAAGMIHRDIKPANIVVCERGGVKDVVKVLDFGLSKELTNPTRAVTHSNVQTIVGTPLYLSPEALVAPDTMDGRSDLYAVGALAYFLLTGAPPFSGSGLLEVCAQHLHSTPVAPSVRRGSRLPAGLDALILNCLSKSMDERPASASALRARLLPFAEEWTEQRASGFWPGERASSSASACAASGWQLGVARTSDALGDLCLTACS